MKNEKSTHTIRLLKRLLKGDALSSSDLMASNSNQYFRTIKENGIALVEVWVSNHTNSGRHKERSLYQSPENIERAKKYLAKLQGVKNEVGNQF